MHHAKLGVLARRHRAGADDSRLVVVGRSLERTRRATRSFAVQRVGHGDGRRFRIGLDQAAHRRDFRQRWGLPDSKEGCRHDRHKTGDFQTRKKHSPLYQSAREACNRHIVWHSGNFGAPFRIKLRTHIPLKYRYNFPRCIVRRRYRFRRHGQSAIDGFCDERLPTIHLAKVGLPSKRTEPSPTSRQCCYKPPLRPAQISHSCSLQPSESRFIRRIFLNGQSNEPSVRSDVHGYILSE